MAAPRVLWERLLPNMIKDDEGIEAMPGGPTLYRTRVPGGWLVATGKGEGCGLSFVPDGPGDWRP
jgi:hypothetical protein